MWEAPGRNRNTGTFVAPLEPVTGSWIHRSGVLERDWAGGEESGDTAKEVGLGAKEVCELPRWPWLLPTLVGHLDNPLAHLLPFKAPSNLLLRPPDPTYLPTCPSLLLTPCFQRKQNPHLLLPCPSEQGSSSLPSPDPTQVIEFIFGLHLIRILPTKMDQP